ncbi:RagB/SusD family nutrient uptake outer membrane protein [Chitinophaga ginsengisegetis]|uniref:RagB/SusD family nutrient uptake outer membrane protein n=1 Tax=Chitinophaga ginsengisegetis TaxID=393003 RepID=UPI000DBA75CE|nr:RagB/SusD family nutrient uptake outer membrane protein [Chitinophaga ginsengisegetis]MDR6567442.1 hypothetical protein [Chitinophaga ginsengisegetis]MDR6647173.1 hypothetical protein [Chitinophaga ginsengisegetis]MDR6653522.1 hypothetical protein [Chitinophaga ginsengisegetis]
MDSIIKVFKKKHNAYIAICIVAIQLLSSCEKLVDVNGPTTSISDVTVYASDATAISVVTGIYAQLSGASLRDRKLTSLPFLTGLSGDELTLYSGISDITLKGYYQNALSTSNLGTNDYWSACYKIVYITNAIIEGVTNSSTLTPSVKQQLLGEAKFLRGFCFFYLVNLYGDIPIVTSSDYKTNSLLARAPQREAWIQIIKDLKEADDLLSSNYLDASLLATTTEKVRPTRWAAKSLLSRVYLYQKNWKVASDYATEVINNTSLYHLDSINGVFLRNSAEAIWQLQPVNADYNTEDARLFVIPARRSPGNSWPVFLSNNLLNSFEVGDQRKKFWINSDTANSIIYQYPYKYKVYTPMQPITEYNTVLRLGEQYLIRAEALMELGDLTGSRNDLNVIRLRAGLSKNDSNTQIELSSAIRHERRVELFTEWGHRWLDLKRTQEINSIMSIVTPQKGGIWNSSWQLYPITLLELQSNPLLTQNTGYN